MRNISQSLLRYHAGTGLMDAGGKRGDSHAGNASGGYGGGDSGGNQGSKEENVETERVAQVANRAFNKAIAQGNLTSAAEVARNEAMTVVKPAVIPGMIANIFAKPAKTMAVVASGPYAPATAALIGDVDIGEKINTKITQSRIDNYVNSFLGRDEAQERILTRDGPMANIERDDRTDSHKTGAVEDPRSATTASLVNKIIPSNIPIPSAIPAATIPLETTTTTPTTTTGSTTPDAESEGISLPVLGAGILALKFLLF